MSFFRQATLLLSALSSLAHVHAAPAPQYLDLAQKYAPQLRFHPDEKNFPSSVDFFLGNDLLLYDKHGPLAGAPFPLTNENIANLPDQGKGTYLTTNISASLNGFLRGQDPYDPDYGLRPTVYVFIDPKDNGVVDLHYWLFFPYSAGIKDILLGHVGYHVGDWEGVTVRTVNGIPKYMDYRAHGESQYRESWEFVPKFSPWAPRKPTDYKLTDPDARPVAYVSRGTHGMWGSPETHIWSFWREFKDETSDGGVYWDTQDHLTVINYPDSYSGSLNWLNYKGNWGNMGHYNCWREDDNDVCGHESGPKGPLEDKSMKVKSRKRSVSKTLLEDLSAHELPSQVL